VAKYTREKLVGGIGDATRHYASDKKSDLLIVLVHFFGGSQTHLLRHVKFLNQMGYDCISFDLSNHKTQIPFSKVNKRFGIVHAWGDEVRQILELTKSEPVVIFSFSNPSASALEALTTPNLFLNVKGLICDGGPFAQLLKCSWNLSREEFKIKNRLIRTFATAGMFALWSPLHTHFLKESITKLPLGFPILSIRAWKDKLVPVSAIDEVFSGHSNIELHVLDLPTAEHLTGLRDAPDIYQRRVSEFLSRLSPGPKSNN
jgi:pimeloyl-ACP methyl ester carboxylesterase